MQYYFEPVNLKQWNMFEKVKNVGHIEPFLAVKSMKIGDIVLLHVGKQDNNVESGVYAYGEVVKEPYILKDKPEDYCNNKNTVDVKIQYINYNEPILNSDKCKLIFTQFRRVYKLSDNSVNELMKLAIL
ncbi:MAG: EVE domain-containing protein [Clostridiales bacterium]|nr:EVE domain-containing protein [Clostridiales bacterium]